MANQDNWNALWNDVEKCRAKLEAVCETDLHEDTLVGGYHGQETERKLSGTGQSSATDGQALDIAKANFQTAVKRWFDSVTQE